MKTNKFPILYHGTDARIVKMSSEERRQYFEHCEKVIDFLFPFYNKLATTYEKVEIWEGGLLLGYGSERQLDKRFKDKLEKIPGLFYNLHNAITLIQGRNSGNGQYQYGSFYVTSMREIAVNYARCSFAGGELGLIAYRYIQGLEFVEFEDYLPSREIMQSMDIVREFGGDESKYDPVIFTFKDVDIDCLQDESGNPLPLDFDDFSTGSSYRLIKDVQLSLDDAEHLKKQ